MSILSLNSLLNPQLEMWGRQPHIRGVRAEDRKLNMEDNIKGRKQKDIGSGTELLKTPDLNGQEKEEEVVSRLGENK